MKPFILFFIASWSLLSYGQKFHKDSLVNNLIKDLKSKQTDTILVYEKGYIGGACDNLIKDDTCFYYGSVKKFYIFWRHNCSDYFTKINYGGCYEYDTLKIDFSYAWNEFFKNEARIKKEEFLMPMIIDKGDTLSVALNHHPYEEIYVFHKKKEFKYYLSDFDFSQSIDNLVNINYKANSKTIRKKLQVYIEKFIREIEINKTLKRKLLYKAAVLSDPSDY